jgi:hypothetical protein
VAIDTRLPRVPSPDQDPELALQIKAPRPSAMPNLETAKSFTNSRPMLTAAMNKQWVARRHTFLSVLVSFLSSKQTAWQPGRQFDELSTSR